MDGFRADAFTAGKSFELFVRMRNTVTAHHGLDSFGQNFPGLIQIGGNGLFVQTELVHAAFQSGVADNAVAEGDA